MMSRGRERTTGIARGLRIVLEIVLEGALRIVREIALEVALRIAP
ncbi:hypothetical protein [Halomonas sp. DP8Y7-3]|nr:hypothetical protein [Halomonas sp. DP8Y7-3]